MRIFEEYHKRHGIDLPLAYHCQNASFVVKTNDKHQWSLVEIEWVINKSHPGYYKITTSVPKHNGYRYVLYEKTQQIEINWNDYEDFMVVYCMKNRGQQIISQENALDAVWKMFLFVFDEWFLQQNEDLVYLLYETVNPDLTKQEQNLKRDQIVSLLLSEYFHVYLIWKNKFFVHVENYAYWMSKLAGD